MVISSCSTSGRMCGAMVIVFHASVRELGFDPVSGKLKYYNPDICCLQKLFIIKIIITESKMNIIRYMYMKFPDTNPDTCILYHRNDEPMWCHSLSKWRYLYKAVRCVLLVWLRYRIFRHKLSRYNMNCT